MIPVRTAAAIKQKTFPVVETFGPTIQGEGRDAGRPCVFVRFGGCDYQCSWCDSLHAVLPAEVRKAKRLTAAQIIVEIVRLTMPPMTVVLSGGNPLLHELQGLVRGLQTRGYRVTVETQGSTFKPWVTECDLVMVSPKPPSSHMIVDYAKLDKFMHECQPEFTALKVVVGSDEDYCFARNIHQRYLLHDFHVSVLNPAGSNEALFNVVDILSRYKGLCERVASDPTMHDVKVFPQLHTLAWGAVQGV